MYVRHEGHSTFSFIPEDRVGKVAMVGSVRSVDPVARSRAVLMMPLHKRADALLRAYLYDRVEQTGDTRERGIIRAFLKQVNAACSDGNPAGIELAIRRGKRNEVHIYANIRGVGQVVWLPTLIAESKPKLVQILRETGCHGVTLAPDHRSTPDNDGQPGRGGFPPPIEIRLIPGQRI